MILCFYRMIRVIRVIRGRVRGDVYDFMLLSYDKSDKRGRDKRGRVIRVIRGDVYDFIIRGDVYDFMLLSGIKCDKRGRL